MAPDITERDGSLSRSRYYSGTRTLLHAASTSDAPCGPPTPDQLVPVAALCSAQGSYTRGPIPDLRGILVPSELVMTSLLHSEDKVHRKGLARAEGLPLLMPRLLSQVLEHLGFPEEPRIKRRIICTQVLSIERSLFMLISIVL